MSQCEPASGHHCIHPSIYLHSHPSIHPCGPFNFSPLHPLNHNPHSLTWIFGTVSYPGLQVMGLCLSLPPYTDNKKDLPNLTTSCSCSKNIQGSPLPTRQSCNILMPSADPSHLISHILSTHGTAYTHPTLPELLCIPNFLLSFIWSILEVSTTPSLPVVFQGPGQMPSSQ